MDALEIVSGACLNEYCLQDIRHRISVSWTQTWWHEVDRPGHSVRFPVLIDGPEIDLEKGSGAKALALEMACPLGDALWA